MSRIDRKFTAAEEAQLDAAELLALLQKQAKAAGDRSGAIACYLSRGDGWRDASQRLGGAFAKGERPSERRDRDEE